MKKLLLVLSSLVLVFAFAVQQGNAGKPVDNDKDGYTSGKDCNDNDATVYPGAPELCDGKDNNCDGVIDEGCGTPPPGGTTHSSLSWSGYSMCLSCHATQANEMFGSVHYQWQGSAPFVNGAATQGKIGSALNAYCVNILGNWGTCGNCHVGLGTMPSTSSSQTQLQNIDCLMCHSKDYKRVKVNGLFQPDPTVNMNTVVQTVSKPVRANCLQCHARGGGGDNFKRGDITLAHANTTDSSFDVHMATSRGNLACQTCHKFTKHRVSGRGSDLRPTDSTVAIGCSTTTCHPTKATATGHVTAAVNKHVARVACQTCHIKTYARNAGDTAATEATEIHRDWLKPHVTSTGAIHPTATLANNLKPKYRFWNMYSWVNNLKDAAVIDPATGNYQISRPVGAINDSASKLYPFKYKTANQPLATGLNMMIAIDTNVYFATGDANAATKQGLVNMGYANTQPYAFVTTDEFQLITHEVMTASQAASCAECHPNASAAQMKLVTEIGYGLKGAQSVICSQCHNAKKPSSYDRMHSRHVDNVKADCSWCHSFSRPERNLTMPK